MVVEGGRVWLCHLSIGKLAMSNTKGGIGYGSSMAPHAHLVLTRIDVVVLSAAAAVSCGRAVLAAHSAGAAADMMDVCSLLFLVSLLV